MEAFYKWRKKCSGIGVKINEHYIIALFFADQIITVSSEEDVDYILRKLKNLYEKWDEHKHDKNGIYTDRFRRKRPRFGNGNKT